MLGRLPFARNAEVVQKSENTLSFRSAEPAGVLVSFFGGLRLAQMEFPHKCSDTGIWLASLRDLIATKLNVVFQRPEAKDYLDICALLEAGLTLADGLACARAVYGSGFNMMLPLKALAFFDDGDLPSLPSHVKDRLARSVRSVTEIPVAVPCAERIGFCLRRDNSVP